MQWYLVILIGIAVGVVGSFCGLGGGALMVPLLLFLGFEAQRAVGTTFVGIAIIALSALAAHAHLQNVQWRWGLLLGIGGFIGAQLGAHLLEFVPTDVFRKIFAVVLVAIAVKMFF
ncbi:MAG: sulfite exporter TauE/SafE family protein [Deltaproteobacteria bacterium]|nr:MAG: sulfite exporter TauE/SafE family protein [Deltaproteobacteria bacterium]